MAAQSAKDEKASAKAAAEAATPAKKGAAAATEDDTVVLKAPKKPGAKRDAALSKEHLLRPDDADDEDPGLPV